MDHLLIQLRACADPTRLRLLLLLGRGSFCVKDLTAILGQSQPRLSRHLKLLTEAGLIDCSREGSAAWFHRVPHPALDAMLAAVPADEPLPRADARAAARVSADRARAASASFQAKGADWDEMRALGLPAERVEEALLGLLTGGDQAARLGQVLDLGTGTGRLIELLAPYATSVVGIDASPAMLVLARDRLARAGHAHASVRRADAYRLPLAEASTDIVVAQMLLHHADDPASMLAEARRVLRPDGLFAAIDLEAGPALAALGLRWPGFDNAALRGMLREAGFAPRAGLAIPGPHTVRIWAARPAAIAAGAA